MRDLAVPLKLAVTLWLAAAAAIHLYFGGFGFPEPITMRGFHLLVFVPPLFLLYPARKASPMRRPSLPDWAWAVAAAAPHAWVMWNWDVVSDRMEYVDPVLADDDRPRRAGDRHLAGGDAARGRGRPCLDGHRITGLHAVGLPAARRAEHAALLRLRDPRGLLAGADRGRRLRAADRHRRHHHRGLHRLRQLHAGQRHGPAVQQPRRRRGRAASPAGRPRSPSSPPACSAR